MFYCIFFYLIYVSRWTYSRKIRASFPSAIIYSLNRHVRNTFTIPATCSSFKSCCHGGNLNAMDRYQIALDKNWIGNCPRIFICAVNRVLREAFISHCIYPYQKCSASAQQNSVMAVAITPPMARQVKNSIRTLPELKSWWRCKRWFRDRSFWDSLVSVSIITLPTTRMICKKKDGCIESFYATYACGRLALAREQNMNVGRRTNRERQLALARNRLEHQPVRLLPEQPLLKQRLPKR